MAGEPASDPGDGDQARLGQQEVDAVTEIAIAEGILVERYQVRPDLASALLHDSARRTGLPEIEAARWLITTGTLP